MATALQTLIDAYIKRNANQEITGPVLNGVLSAIADALNTPFIGQDDGDWYEYDPETGEFVNSGVHAQGESGVNDVWAAVGVSPDPQALPSVQVDYNATLRQLGFTFYDIQGPQGPQGTPGITGASVSVDANVGTPSVDASIVNGILTLAFHNLKGASAGFGTPTISVGANQGTPSASVTASGPDTAKVFAFAFDGLKGETGPQGPQGPQGNPGSSVDYPFTLANNLTTDDSTVALTAAMGVQLESEVSQLSQEVDGLPEDSKTVTLAVTAGTGVTYNNSLKECRLYKGRTYRIVLSGTINAISMYFRNAANSESITVDYDDAGASGTSISFASNVKEHTVTPREDVFYVRFYAGASSITNTGDMVWDFVSEGVPGIKDKADYAYEHIQTVEPKADYAYEKVQELLPTVDALDDGLVGTRNISPLPKDITVTQTAQVFGEQGVVMLPPGMYAISFEASSLNNVTVDCIGYFIGVAGGVSLINQQGVSDGRVAIGWDFEYPLDRLLFRTHSSTEYEILLSDIQIERIDWKGYTSSPNKGDWSSLPYATPYIGTKTLLDGVSRHFSESYWRGKKINYNGDSVTQGIGTSRVGYAKVVNQFLQFGTVRNYAIGGTRLAHVSDVVNCLVDRISEMSTDADIVFIMANTNDYASQVPIGATDSSDISTYNGALNSIFTWLKANYPTQPIIISTMLTRKINYDGGQPLPITIEQYADAVRQKVAEYGFILYDAYKWSGLDLLNTPTDGTGVSNDGLHPNEAGALSLGRKIAKFIDAQ